MDTPDPARATKTSGEILFALCLALTLSIYLLNDSLADRRDLRSRQWERHEAYSEMIERLRSFRAKDPALFEKLAFSSLTIAHMLSEDEARYPGLLRSVSTGPHSKAFLELPEQRRWDLRAASEVFGKNASQAFSAHPSQDDRTRELRTLVTDAFKQDAEAALFLNNEVVPRLAALDTPSEWDRIAWWIANGVWPEPSGTFGDVSGGITFGKRFAEQPSELSDRFYVYRLVLRTPSPLSPDQELFNLWKASYVDQRTAPAPSPRLALPTIGLSISPEAVVAGAAPILVLFQLVFLVHWERRRKNSSPADSEAFSFPSYACPNDPLNGPMPKTLGEVVQRCVWAFFLILPIALLAFGLLSRYDIIYPLGYFGNGRTTTLFQAELQARSEDFLSTTLDWITFVCITLSALTVLSITHSRGAHEPRSKRERVVAFVGWLVAITAAVACIRTTRFAFDAFIAPLENGSEVHFKMHYLVAFGVFWSLCVGVAVQRRARFLALVSVAGLTVFVLHFVPF